jgi:hypothetical protein
VKGFREILKLAREQEASLKAELAKMSRVELDDNFEADDFEAGSSLQRC